MDHKKDLTKELLADCFRELMMTTPFDKITIKMITDRAGLIRPTFYKHFQDKYEVLEWIFNNDVAGGVDLLIDNRMEFEAVSMLCNCLDRDRKFYRRAYAMEPGPNSFDNVLTRYINSCLYRIADRRKIDLKAMNSAVSPETVASYYTYAISNTLKDWITSDDPKTADEMSASYSFLFTHSILEAAISGTV